MVFDRAPTSSPVGPRLDRLYTLRHLTRAAGATLFVKERADLALAVGADGLHLGEHGLASRDARTFGLLISRACHDRAGLERADNDLTLLSPVANPGSKPASGPPLGVDGFGRAIAGLTRPVYALGGIVPGLAAPLRRAGATGLAVLSGVLSAARPGPAALSLLQAWDTEG